MTEYGPCLDIYALSDRRSEEIVAKFIGAYADMERSEDRGDEELMMVPLGYEGALSDLGRSIQWDWQRSGSLSEILTLGLGRPVRAFCVYLTPKDETLCRVELAFTRDSRVVLGVSVPYGTETQAALKRAESILTELIAHSGATVGIIAVEIPPPLDGAELEEMARNPDGFRILQVWRGDAT